MHLSSFSVTHLPIPLPTQPAIYLSTYLPFYIPIHTCLTFCLFVCLSECQSVYLSLKSQNVPQHVHKLSRSTTFRCRYPCEQQLYCGTQERKRNTTGKQRYVNIIWHCRQFCDHELTLISRGCKVSACSKFALCQLSWFRNRNSWLLGCLTLTVGGGIGQRSRRPVPMQTSVANVWGPHPPPGSLRWVLCKADGSIPGRTVRNRGRGRVGWCGEGEGEVRSCTAVVFLT